MVQSGEIDEQTAQAIVEELAQAMQGGGEAGAVGPAADPAAAAAAAAEASGEIPKEASGKSRIDKLCEELILTK